MHPALNDVAKRFDLRIKQYKLVPSWSKYGDFYLLKCQLASQTKSHPVLLSPFSPRRGRGGGGSKFTFNFNVIGHFAFGSRRFPLKRNLPITYHDFLKEETDPNLLLSKRGGSPLYFCLFPTLLLFSNECSLPATGSKPD